jgi:UDP-N-acetylmuramate dehydrogenase
VRGPADEWFLSAELLFPPADAGGQDAIRDLLARRKATQPIGQPSCGSVFRNPEGDHAARLIETAGLKGYCVGGACVSGMHANFIINTGDATALDIERLVDHVVETVARVHGVTLQPEVRVIGEPS